MNRLLPSGPLTEQPIPAKGKAEFVLWSPGPGRTSVLDMIPPETSTLEIILMNLHFLAVNILII